MNKDTMEIVKAAETLADSFEEAAKDGNLSVWDLWHFSDDFDEIEAAYRDATNVGSELQAATNEELKEIVGRLSVALVRIAKSVKPK